MIMDCTVNGVTDCMKEEAGLETIEETKRKQVACAQHNLVLHILHLLNAQVGHQT